MTKAVEILAREHDERDGAYEKALWLIDQMARGLIAPGRVSVDLQARTYSWLSQEEWEAKQPKPAARPELTGALNGRANGNGHAPLRVEGGIEGLRKLAEEADSDSEGGEP